MNSSEDDVGDSNDHRQQTNPNKPPKRLGGTAKVIMQRQNDGTSKRSKVVVSDQTRAQLLARYGKDGNNGFFDMVDRDDNQIKLSEYACELKEEIFLDKIENEGLKQTQSSYSFSTQVVTVVYTDLWKPEISNANDLLSCELAEAKPTPIQVDFCNNNKDVLCIGKFFVDEMMA